MAQASMVEIGDPGTIFFQIEWDSSAGSRTADEKTRGALTVSVDGAPIWVDRSAQAPTGIRWSMIEILEHLTYAWPYLESEQCDPLRLCDRPDKLRAQAEKRWESMPAEQRIREQREMIAFEDTHDLARAFQGLWLPSIWLLRQGRLFWIVSPTSSLLQPFESVMETLSELGDVIAQRLSGVTDGRAEDAIAAWQRRGDVTSPDTRLQISTGLSASLLSEIARDADPTEFFERGRGFESSELVAVARMTGGFLPPADIRNLLDEIRGMHGMPGTLLGEWTDKAESVLADSESEAPYDQGYEIARWFRTGVLDLADSMRVDPDGILREMGIEVMDIDLPTPALDAICAWGPERGPVILVNENGRHGKGQARRATLAHEICHLLIDRRGALPLAEVKGGSVDSGVESRARAFAAELLVPRDVAGSSFSDADPARVLRSLTQRYGVSSEIVAWQARNSSIGLPSKAYAFLRGKVSMPDRF